MGLINIYPISNNVILEERIKGARNKVVFVTKILKVTEELKEYAKTHNIQIVSIKDRVVRVPSDMSKDIIH